MKLQASLAALAFSLAACGGQSSDTPSSTDTASQANSGTSVAGPATQERTDIRIVGSSTVYPFSTKVAQEFKNKTGVNVVVESTGSGGGHKLFCSGNGTDTPDITNSSRRQKSSELDNCAKNGVDNVIEVKIGFDGIVIANARTSASVDLTLEHVYKAFAKQVPTSNDDCTMIANPNKKWSDIDASLPDETIEAYGPPPTSGTRDAFVEIAMEGGAKQIACLKALKDNDKDMFGTLAHTLREDGRWIDSGENDNAIVQTLVNTPTAYGVFGYSFLDQNADKIKGALVGGAEPSFENIASGDYPISRSLFFYIKQGHIEKLPAIKDYALEFVSDEAAASGGYLEAIGLVPLPDDERAAVRASIQAETAYSH